MLIAGVSFVDDIHSLPDSVRLVAQFVAMGLMFWNLFWVQDSWFMVQDWYWKVLIVLLALIVFVGATNIINFMDGINGITAGYSLAVLVPLMLVNDSRFMVLETCGTSEQVRANGSSRICELENGGAAGFVEPSLIVVTILAVLVFSWFNFRPRGKAKCFAGDVGSVGIGFILLFCIGKLILATNDITWLIFLVVYGVDGVMTILHRIMLHENLGEAHRKHAYQLMANELGMSHVTVILIYMALQLVISLGMIYLVPDTVIAHWGYLIGVVVVLSVAYILFMRRYYHLHVEYLASLRK